MTIKATSWMERIVWASLGILGMAWIIFFIQRIVVDENPIISKREKMDLSEVDYPAITICSEQTTKYAFAERLGNYLNPELEMPDGLEKLKKNLIDEQLINRKYNFEGGFYIYKKWCKGNQGQSDGSCKVKNQINEELLNSKEGT